MFNQDGPAGEGEIAGDVVDDIDLANVEAGLKRLQREFDLEDYSLAVGGGDFIRDDGLGFVDLGGSLQELDAG